MDFTGKIALAPMAGICDLPFRLLCKEMGCDIVYTEMVSAKGMYYNNKNTGPLLMTKPEEAPIGVQIFGSEPELMASQAKRLEDKGFLLSMSTWDARFRRSSTTARVPR